uniref:Uncharacterized protein n=1 Tax=Kwoniella dejecticola CBS 10117 TaxID=1296121 RepID=A0A1A6AG50_9TREE|nr:uncharacterized protein I303_00835 [Kwoniella dejecticola CBS 10117]OBR89013.1 hypothetical protein I303_00835 [Kwoniella dejecticola CBS 10117]
MDDHTFHLGDEHDVNVDVDAQVRAGNVAHDDDAAEAVLASLRAVINEPAPHHSTNTHPGNILDHVDVGHDEANLHEFVHDSDHEHGLDVEQSGGQQQGRPTIVANPLIVWFEQGLAMLEKAILDNKMVVDELNSPNAIQNLAHNLKALGEGSKKESGIIEDLKDRLEVFKQEPGITIGSQNILQAFTTDIGSEASPFVLRTDYDALKSEYDALASLNTNKRGRKGGAKKAEQNKGQKSGENRLTPLRDAVNQGIFSADNQNSGLEGRKKRSIKLEHLVHKMANRRIGVEYQVTNFESKGSKELPDPASTPPKADEAINGVDEYRPDFQAEWNAESVKPFIDKVIEDVMDALKDEPEIDQERVVAGVQIYWTRLSLLARRLAAFDSSPLNICRLRALYRTLLTIDFAAPTQDSPDLKREYTEDEWKAYRKLACGRRAAEAHEVIDQHWISPMVRKLLMILDVYWADMNARARKKGRPKQPNPTFHLPPHLWDKSTLPTLRPKDATGLPVAGAAGIVLFKFHVDEQVQRDNPEWAKGLYDNPPISEDNSRLPTLTEVMALNIYAPLKAPLMEARKKADPDAIPLNQVEEILSRPEKSPTPPPVSQEGQESTTLPTDANANANAANIENGEYATLLALNRLEKISPVPMGGMDVGIALNSNMDVDTASSLPGLASNASHLNLDENANADPNANGKGKKNKRKGNTSTFPPGTEDLFIIPATSNILGNLTAVNEPIPGPSAGSSWRARKLGKRLASEVPGGAATPVPKRSKHRSTQIRDPTQMELEESVLGMEGQYINHLDDSVILPQDQEVENAEPGEDEGEDEEDEKVREEVQGDAAFLDTL